MRIAELAGMKAAAKRVENWLGIEFECEGAERYHDARQRGLDPAPFIEHQDNSLRGASVELTTAVLKTNAERDEVLKVYEQRAREFRFEFSARTSVHIHVNVRDMEQEAAAIFMATLLAVEPVLLRLVESPRRTNLFAVPLSQSPHLAGFLNRLMHAGPGDAIPRARADFEIPMPRMNRLPEFGKYSAVGTQRLYDLGTIEFRSMHGTADATRIGVLCDALLACKEYARVMPALAFSDEMLHIRPAELYDKIFGGPLLQALRALSLGGNIPASEQACIDAAQLCVLAAKGDPTGAKSVRASSIRGQNGPLDAKLSNMLLMSTPALPAALMRMLSSLQVGASTFGIRRVDNNIVEHTVIINEGVYSALYEVPLAQARAAVSISLKV